MQKINMKTFGILHCIVIQAYRAKLNAEQQAAKDTKLCVEVGAK